MAFGWKHRNDPTPESIVFRIKLYTIIASSVAVWLPTAEYIPDKVEHFLMSFLSLTTAIFNGVSSLWGEKISRKTVPVQDVKVISDEAIKALLILIATNVFLYSL